MISIETDAVVTEGGRMIINAPAHFPVGIHRVRLTVIADSEKESTSAVAVEEMPVPKRFLKGRPVFDEDDLREMIPHLPPEDDWADELGIA